ncbi:CDP-alcohol phosphatidyltransferase family protein [Chthonobacter albigriseus]|uniref:CDP-alcohol phosphatidyltransferase family protein n=1 Tax=Chthonobacter albigriseus TaxID=1683161 RepID=UPI0015EF2D38|nr:CDP-alcohol phosphatidyltransferase family protein [Chthonobacter albigriseus]
MSVDVRKFGEAIGRQVEGGSRSRFGDVMRTAATALPLLAALLAGGFAPAAIGLAALVFLVGAALVARAASDLPRFGLPNTVTWLRFAATAGLAGAALALPADTWAIAAVALAVVLLDGVDGWLARRFGPVTAFGARFDMETDALLILVLCAFAVSADKIGPWILLAGLMRYAFVAAAAVWPWLAGALPPSFRRKLVCVVQIAALIAVAAPPVGPTAAIVLGGVSLGALAWSFTVDILWLRRNGPAAA